MWNLGLLGAAGGTLNVVSGWDYLDEVTVGATPMAAIEFTDLDTYASSYDTLFLSWVAKSSSLSYDDIMILQINNDNTNSYDFSRNFTYASSTSNTQEHITGVNHIQPAGFSWRGTGAGAEALAFSFGEMEFPAFSKSHYKTVFGRASGMTGTYNETGYHMGIWKNNNPITSIKLTSYYGFNFTEHSQFVLYGKGK